MRTCQPLFGRLAGVSLLCALLALSACGEDALVGSVVQADQLAADDTAALDSEAATDAAAAGSDSAGKDTASPDTAGSDVTPSDAATTDAEGSDPGDAGGPDAAVGQTDGTAVDSADAADLPDGASATCPGALGCACELHADCAQVGGCVETGSGKACVPYCQSGKQGCPDGTVCANLPGDLPFSDADDFAACVPKFVHLCEPCIEDADCATVGLNNAACVTDSKSPGEAGWFCSVPCASDAQCPSDYTCVEAQTTDVEWGNYCRPKDNADCGCSATAIAAGLSTTCAASTELPGGVTVTCVGYRTCSVDGLSACSKPVVSTELCNGMDDDCDGETDEAALCDDGLPCTTEVCIQGDCVASSVTGPCDDGNACTSGELCTATGCVGNSLACDDNNPCTDDSCDKANGCVFAPNSIPCDDDNACTLGEKCSAGQCSGGTPTCGCETDEDCKKADDGNACNGTWFCAQLGETKTCVQAANAVKCDSSNDTSCVQNVCQPDTGSCAMTDASPGTTCDDGSACTTSDSCTMGSCAGTPLPCNDADACTADSCDPTKGCVYASGGLDCDDGFVCTADSCNPVTGKCVHTPLGEACVTSSLPYLQPFDCGAEANQLWQLGAAPEAGKVQWSVANAPAALSASGCVLKLGNGTDLTCPQDQALLTESAESPIFDATALSPGASVRLRLQSAGDWPANSSATLQVRIDGGSYEDLAFPTPSAGWQAIDLKSTAWAGHKIQFRLRFSANCSTLTGKAGWWIDQFSVVVDQCAVNSGGCGQFATCDLTLVGEVVCTPCATGYVASNNVCIDIDECLVPGTCIDTASCGNTPGSFTCTCKTGYSGDGKSCADVDECTTGKDDCAPSAACINNIGSFQCVCPKDEVGNGKVCTKLGYGADNPAPNCKEILTKYGAAADGNYWIDPDGSGALPATQYYCDMKNGGWVLINYDDFENSSQSGWSAGPVSTCGDYGKILGGYNNWGSGVTASKTLTAPQHTEAKLTMQFIRIDTWDDERGYVFVDGAKVFDQQWKGNIKYSGDPNKKCGQGNWLDGRWDVAWSGAHTATTLTVSASTNLNEGAGNESFGIDNVAVWVR